MILINELLGTYFTTQNYLTNALSVMYPSLDLQKSVSVLKVGDLVVLKKQEWG